MHRWLPWIAPLVLIVACSDDDDSVAGSSGSGGASAGRASVGGLAGRPSGTGGMSIAGGTSGSAGRATGGIRADGGASGGAGRGGAAGSTVFGGTGGTTGGVAGSSTSVGGVAGGTGGVVVAGGLGGVTAGSGGSIAIGGQAPSTGGAAGTPSSSGGAPGGTPGAAGSGGSETGMAGMAGTPSSDGGAGGNAGTAGSSPVNTACGPARDSLIAWWSFDGTLESRRQGRAVLAAVPDTESPAFAGGVASGQSLDIVTGPFVEVSDSAFDVTDALTLSAFIKSAAPDGRVIDRISYGGTDGYLMDVVNRHLRMIIGSRLVETDATLGVLNEFVHVAAVFTGGTSPEVRLYVDGALTDTEPVEAGAIPSNALSLRIGADRSGTNRFTGQIDEPMVFARALTDAEILGIRDRLAARACPEPEATCPRSGLVLAHDAAGEITGGVPECLLQTVRRAGDLQVLAGDSLYTCQWPAMPGALVSCQASVPFATAADTSGEYLAPTAPLEWRLFRFNNSGHIDEIGYQIESHSQTLHQQTHAALSWFGRDWRIERYANAADGSAILGSLGALSGAVQGGAGVGLFIPAWNCALPHLTALLSIPGGHWAGLDPFHVSVGYSADGDYELQSDAYHYGVWLNTAGYWSASRWFFGSPSGISDSSGTEPFEFRTEPGWTEVLAHDAAGEASAGSLGGLLSAIEAGATVRIGAADGYFDCGTTSTSATDATCLVRDVYDHVDDGAGNFSFSSSHPRSLRYYTTSGRALTENWDDHTATLASTADQLQALRWFARAGEWNLALATGATGETIAGSKTAIVSAVQSGAEVMVARRVGATWERVLCDSLKIDAALGRAACLRLDQVPLALTGGQAAGYYEARVYNTNGVVASARVAFGSTTTSDASAPVYPLRWLVRGR